MHRRNAWPATPSHRRLSVQPESSVDGGPQAEGSHRRELHQFHPIDRWRGELGRVPPLLELQSDRVGQCRQMEHP